jgi:hypothetical protein
LHQKNAQAYFLIRATSGFRDGQDELVDWVNNVAENKQAKLVVEYVERNKKPLSAPTNLHTIVENDKVKILWENPKSEDIVGSFVIRNRFHPPRSPYDGVKLYGGPDEYTFDSFGNPNIPKYYAVFSYDNVPNFSQASCVHFSVDQTIPIEEIDPEEVELQLDGEMRNSSDSQND